MILLILSVSIAFSITFFTLPTLIKAAGDNKVYDEPGLIKTHPPKISRLGGICILVGLIFSLIACSSPTTLVRIQFVIFSLMLIFFIGIRDDLNKMRPWKKLFGEIIFALSLVHLAGIRITTFYGLFNIWDLPIIPSYMLSIFTIIVITNSINLIDGVDGLAAIIGIIATLSFGTWFYCVNAENYAVLAFSLLGALMGFYWYNRSPAKIFMGDSGSLLIGGILSLLAIKFIEMNRIMDKEAAFKVLSVPVVTIAILIIPLFDTLRVFVIRTLNKKSPFQGDRNHLHHTLLDFGFTQNQVTYILGTFNLVMIGFVYLAQGARGEILLVSLIIICILISYGLMFWKKKWRR